MNGQTVNVNDQTSLKHEESCGDCAIMMLDVDGQIRGWTISAEHLTGWTKAIVGSSHGIFYSLDQRKSGIPEIALANARSGEFRNKITCRRRDGSTFVAEITLTALYDADDRLRGYAHYIRDMTGSEQIAALRAQNERAAALGQLASGVAHDFNNILQVIAGSASLIEESPTNMALVRRCAERMIKAADRGAAISGRLLGFARRSNGAAPVDGLNIKSLFDSIQDLLTPLLPANVNVITTTEADLPLVLADQAQLETVLVNLATNARDAMTSGGNLLFSAKLFNVTQNNLGLLFGDYVRVTVTDSGIGMDAAMITQAMEPYFTTKPQGRGTGLGLSLARDFARQSGGALEITSEPNVLTQVKLWLPLAISIKDTTPKRSEVVATKQIAGRILVVEDDELVRETMVASLAQAGFTPIEVVDGESALTTLNDPALKVSALVVDYALPGMTGVTVIREAQRGRISLPALLVTGNIGEMLVDDAHPKFSMLRKPFTPAQLATAVGLLLPES
jgi:PAS domain S-box-containing protein